MTWLLKLATGNPLVLLYAAIGIAVAAGAVGGAAAWKVQGWRLDAVKAEYAAFVTKTKAAGEIQEAKAKQIDAQNRANKEVADATLAKNVQAIAVSWAADRTERDRLRQQLADSRSRAVPPITTGTGLSCDQASRDAISAAVSGYVQAARGAFDECRAAIGEFREATARQLEQADLNTAALTCGMEWAGKMAR